jgi:hypothetical protein
MSESRNLRYRGQVLGPHSLAHLYRMATDGKIDHAAEFLSASTNEWRPLSGIMEDFYPSKEKLEQMRESGITKVTILGSGEDCPACHSLQQTIYPIDEPPMLPPEGCKCVPWCRCEVVAKA